MYRQLALIAILAKLANAQYCPSVCSCLGQLSMSSRHGDLLAVVNKCARISSCPCAAIFRSFATDRRRKRAIAASAPLFVKSLATCVTAEYGRMGIIQQDVQEFRETEKHVKSCIYDNFAGPVLETFVRQCVNRVGISEGEINDVFGKLHRAAGPEVKAITDGMKQAVSIADAVLEARQ